MPRQQVQAFVKAGDWRTLNTYWNSPAGTGRFLLPAGAQIKVRYGDGWPLGKDRQKQTLDGIHPKDLVIGKWSLLVARMQIKVQSDSRINFELIFEGP